MARGLRNSYHWPARPPASERSNARCVTIQQGSAAHRRARFISLPVWLRSQLEYSKYQYFIESSDGSDANSDANSDTYTYANSDPNAHSHPDSNSDPNTHADTHSKHAWTGRVGARREPRL